MSNFAGRKRKGCADCGKHVMALDQARGDMRRASTAYGQNPTTKNREKAARVKQILDETKKFHDEHMAGHEEIGDK